VDPIARVQRYLEARTRWDPARAEPWAVEIEREIRDSMERAATYPAPKPEDVFDHVYANPPARVLQQRDDLLRSVER
jgi:pyruvate dehydrogenase E1 component alpha subunit